MSITRRTLSALALLALCLPAYGQDVPKELRIGFQKTGILVVARQGKTIEKRLAEQGVDVRWVEFTAGPPLMEALNAGSLDLGFAGDAPPIFSQSAGANVVYVAATPSSGAGEAIIVKAGSPVRTVAELKGKRVAVAKGTSAHNLLVAAIEKAGLAPDDISPVYLGPPDGVAAFARDSVDAWVVWDPFLAMTEKREATRQLTTTEETLPDGRSFVLANADFAKQFPKLVATSLDGLQDAARHAAANRDAVAVALAEATGTDLAVQQIAARRRGFDVFPLSEATLATQQATADRFHRLGLIPKAVTVRDIVWTRPQS
jgi:sulfonate transport system substrate-binding protein